MTVATLIAVKRGGASEPVNLAGKLVRWETLFEGVKGTTLGVAAKVKAVCILKVVSEV